jgi:polysaccharide export outer membrane protein
VAAGTLVRDGAIGPDDVLEIAIFEAPELNRTVKVSQAGDISVPLIGVLNVAGLTPREVEERLRVQLQRSYMHDPHVTVEVKEVGTPPIYVVGEVEQPGAFIQSGRSSLTVLQAVSMAQGLKPSAAHDGAVVIRTVPDGERLRLSVNLKDVMSGKAEDLVLQPNDILYVPENKQRAIALGAVDLLVRVVTFRAVF